MRENLIPASSSLRQDGWLIRAAAGRHILLLKISGQGALKTNKFHFKEYIHIDKV
jgi:hypothetical protein